MLVSADWWLLSGSGNDSGKDSLGNPESSGEDSSDSDDETSANGPPEEHVCHLSHGLIRIYF